VYPQGGIALGRIRTDGNKVVKEKTLRERRNLHGYCSIMKTLKEIGNLNKHGAKFSGLSMLKRNE
jgi:hypothetical protein